jgi:DNA-binding NarL/FixJ family response regulator
MMKSSVTSQPVRIVLADDHDLVRSGIKALLSMIDGVEVIAEARDGKELIGLVENLMPDVVMTDISMPGMDGITAISEIHGKHPEVRMLVLSMYDTVDFVKRAVANGACGYLMKDAPPSNSSRRCAASWPPAATSAPPSPSACCSPPSRRWTTN